MLPANYHWIDITVPLETVYKAYRKEQEVVVFASGDPLFYGFAVTLKREFPDAEFQVMPTFNSLQTLAHRLVMPYNDMRMVSLTGRPWDGLDQALIEDAPLIGLLTDRKHTPAAVAQRLLDFGYENYSIYVGELLGNDEKERISHPTLVAATKKDWECPNCIILKRENPRIRPWGIPDDSLMGLQGRPRMITKKPIRLLTLSLLDLPQKHSFWDIGFCTGSISIEAKLRFSRLQVTSFEIRPECEAIMTENCRRMGTPGITTVMGDFLSAPLEELPRPDAVFIGGHGGRLAECMERICQFLLPGGVVVMNSVTQESEETFLSTAAKMHLQVKETHRLTLDDFNPITLLKIESPC